SNRQHVKGKDSDCFHEKAVAEASKPGLVPLQKQVDWGYERVTYTCTCLKSRTILSGVEAQEGKQQAIRGELERVLSSATFARSERLSRFLRFVVERDLEGEHAEIKESLIGVKVFARKPGYDPKQDSIVRTEAGRLRARLIEYYAREGRGDSIIIE